MQTITIYEHGQPVIELTLTEYITLLCIECEAMIDRVKTEE